MNSTLQRALCAVLPLSMLATAMIWAGGEEEEAPAAAGEAAMEGAYQEAPMLAAMVKAGQLPPVDERLPSNPKVVEPYDSIGQYGGTLRMIDVNNNMSIGLRVRHTGLFRYNQTASQSETDLAASHTWSNNNSTLTIELRDGLRWSDGEPFTTADLMFKWEHEILNEEVHPRGIDPFWTIGGKRAVWEAVDDTTLSITWGAPNPVAMDRFGRTHFSGDNALFLPAHYVKQFHADFNDDAAALATELGFETWVNLFNDRRAQGYNQSAVTVGRPYLDMHTPEVVESTRVLLVRNPYYHHVDTAGNQLPYIDRFEVAHVGDKQLYDLKVSAGEVDFAAYYTGAPSLPTYKAGEEQGNYTTYIAQSLRPAELILFLNLNIEDPVLHDLFNNKDFRVGLSVALNRDQMNEIVFFGMGDAHPATPLNSMEFFDQAWYNDNLAFDVERANQLLDGSGLTQKDSDGFRVRPDNGKRLSLVIEIGVLEGPKEALCELVSNDWRQVGIEGACKVMDGALMSERIDSNLTAVSAWHMGRSTLLGRGTPDQYAFERCAANSWGRQWCYWFVSGGESGIEPPDEIKALNERWQAFKGAATGTPEAVELGKAYFAYFANELPMIPTIGLAPHPVVIHNRLKNVPSEDIFWGSDTNFYAPYKPEQWYIVQ